MQGTGRGCDLSLQLDTLTIISKLGVIMGQRGDGWDEEEEDEDEDKDVRNSLLIQRME